jgi:hypothetical protein
VEGPDFVCLGMQKSGTRWLYEQLTGRPDVWMPPVKEIDFFEPAARASGYAAARPRLFRKVTTFDVKARLRDPAERAVTRRFIRQYLLARFHAGDFEWYRGLFRDKGARISGDISPKYSALDAAEVHRAVTGLPDTRFLLLLRDPVERLWSALLHQVRVGRCTMSAVTDPLLLLDTVQQPSIRAMAFPTAIWTAWSAALPPERLKHWFMDDIVRAPATVRDDICRYLGVQPGPGAAAPDYNSKAGNFRIPMPERLRPIVVDYLAEELERCAEQFDGPAVQWRDRWLGRGRAIVAADSPAPAPELLTTVSIILPVLNQAQFLPDTLPALLAQEGVSATVDVIVVDNGSADGSVAIAESFPGVRVLHEARRGSYAARNHGVRASHGAVVVFLDPDCRPHSGWLAAALRTLDQPGVEIVLGSRRYGSSRVMRWLDGYEEAKIRYVLGQPDPAYVFGYTNNMAMRRTLIARLGQFREISRGADTLFTQVAAHSFGVAAVRFEPAMTVDHLEIGGVREYMAKRSTYGASNVRITQASPFRPLTFQRRLTVLRRTIRDQHLRPREALGLAALLVPAGLLYIIAGLRARFRL